MFTFGILDEATGKPLCISPDSEFDHHPSAGIVGQNWLIPSPAPGDVATR